MSASYIKTLNCIKSAAVEFSGLEFQTSDFEIQTLPPPLLHSRQLGFRGRAARGFVFVRVFSITRAFSRPTMSVGPFKSKL